ncbi:hypothetical protein [Streptacidiphilus carbonis]|uniref:hypothetical protein n=1 Tax=Streptacidiphilus carbonis TaxID=105422 RepID=UPI0005A79516|nr:hypothetical protein [Streptacidiphilus carbonis]
MNEETRLLAIGIVILLALIVALGAYILAKAEGRTTITAFKAAAIAFATTLPLGYGIIAVLT